MFNSTSKHAPGQPSIVDIELAQLAEAGFARLLADNGHAASQQPSRVGNASGGGETHNPAPLTTSVRQDGVVCGKIYCNAVSIPQSDADLQLIAHKNQINAANYTKRPDQHSKNTYNDTYEQSRRERAERLGVEYVAPGEVSDSFRDLPSNTDCLRTDSELARICAIGFKHYPQYQRYLVLHQMSRETGKQGFTFDELLTACKRLGVKGCETYTRRVIRKGINTYWHYDHATEIIYPVGYIALCKWAVQYAYDLGLHDLYLYGNHPGQRRDMYVSVSGAGADFEGAVLSAWYGAHGCPTISRHTLSLLLNRDARSIRRMERRACIRITYNEAQTTDPAAVPLKADGTLRGDVIHASGVWSYRLPNTYTPRMTRQHHKRGQGRKANCWFKHWLEQPRLPGEPEANIAKSDMGKLNSVSRNYCETDRTLNASRDRGNVEPLYVATGKQHRGRVWLVDAVYQDIYS
jgi:hypothetical protein